MAQPLTHPHAPRWYWVPVRIALITFLLTLLSFAVCLLLGILGLAISGSLRGALPNMALAYRRFAFPAAMGVAAVALISVSTVEIRRFRQVKALAGIVRASS